MFSFPFVVEILAWMIQLVLFEVIGRSITSFGPAEALIPFSKGTAEFYF